MTSTEPDPTPAAAPDGDKAVRLLRRLALADARRVPWRNGRGMTEELAVWPGGTSLEADDFDWRITRSVVTEDGSFSEFPGIDRVLVVTSGAGLRLDHGRDAPRVSVPPHQPCRFAGEWATTASLIDGPVADFNVLTRRGRCRAEVTVLRPGPRSMEVRELRGTGHNFAHVLSGSAELRVTGVAPAKGSSAGASGADAARDDLFGAGDSLWIGGAATADPDDEPTLPRLELGARAAGCVVLLVRFADGDASR